MQSVDSWAAIWPPLSLAVLASIARKHGEVDLMDCNVEDDGSLKAVLARVERFRPDVVVVNTSFPSIESDDSCAAEIRKAAPGAKTLGFGVFFTLLEKKGLEGCPGFDLALVGEPEETFDELLKRVETGASLEGIAGLLWRAGGQVLMGPPRAWTADLDTLPIAARDLLRNERYVLPNNGHPFTLINVARGCPYPCIYCIAPAYYGKKLRTHSVDYVIREVELCMKEYGLKDFLFWEEVFTLDKEYGLALCQAIVDKKLDITWATTTRADQVDLEIAVAMKKAGCMMLGLGIESGDQAILDNAKKHATVQQMKDAVAICKQAGLKTMGHFIFGLPGETPETAENTIQFAKDLGLDYMQCYCAVPYPKTPLGEMAREKGWLLSDRWSDYDFGGSSIMNVGSIPPQAVDHAREEMFRSFYLRPGFILAQAADLLKHPAQFIQASKFLNWMRTGKK